MHQGISDSPTGMLDKLDQVLTHTILDDNLDSLDVQTLYELDAYRAQYTTHS